MGKSTILLLACLLSHVICLKSNPLDEEWSRYKERFAKHYENELDEKAHFETWSRNVDRIAKHNVRADNGYHSFKLGVNALTDMNRKQYINTMLIKSGRNSSPNLMKAQSGRPQMKSPVEFDWRTKGVVSPVSNQGPCGSAAIFTTVDCLQSQAAIKNISTGRLSQQQLRECCKKDSEPCTVCSGDYESPVEYFKCINSIGGLDSEGCYPNEQQCDACHFKKQCSVMTVSGYGVLAKGDEAALKDAVALIGPIPVYIDASHISFQLYTSGVYDEVLCNSDQLDHTVLIVGYGTDNGRDYWLVKNSWGSSWGEEGYIRMSRNKKNQCGIATNASYPTVKG